MRKREGGGVSSLSITLKGVSILHLDLRYTSCIASRALTHLATAGHFNAGAATATGVGSFVPSHFNQPTYNESSSNFCCRSFTFVNL